MNRSSVYALIGLASIWVILVEELTVLTVATGVVVGIGCLIFARRFIPLGEVQGVWLHKLLMYPFYLVVQIYIQGILLIPLIFKGIKTEIVQVEIELKNDFLRAVLANSVTLVPGSISMDINEETLTLLNLAPIESENGSAEAQKAVSRLERKLLKAEKRG